MRPQRLTPVLLGLLIMLGAACSSTSNQNTATPVTTLPPAASVAAVQSASPAAPSAATTVATPARTPAGTPARPASSSPAAAPVSGNLTVFAAASLTEVFTKLGDAFRQANPAISIKFNYGASSALRTQLAQGAPADVFASADQANMDGARQDGSIDGPDQLFVKNKLVVVYPRNSTKVTSIQDLAKPGLNFVLTDPSVPIGNDARQALAKLAADPAYGAGFDQKVLANLKSNEPDVKGVVSKVQLGEADAGIVYATDAATAANDVTAILIPDQFNIVASYPIAAVKQAQNKAAGQAFISFVRSAAGQDLLKQAGFIVDSTTGASSAAVGGHRPSLLSYEQAGGYSPSVTIGGAVDAPSTDALADLQALPSQTIDVQYLAGTGPVMKTYTGVRLYDLLLAAQPQQDPAHKNDLLRDSILVTGSDGYQAVIAWGEIDPGFEDKAVLVAYADGSGQPLDASEGMARLVVPGDQKGGRYVSNVVSITVLKPASE